MTDAADTPTADTPTADTPTADTPTDPMADPSLVADPPHEPAAVEAAERMNDADGPQPGVAADPPEPADDDPLPEPLP